MIDTNEFTRRLRGEVRSGIARRRRWPAAEKGRIVAEAVAPRAVFAEVAHRHDLTKRRLLDLDCRIAHAVGTLTQAMAAILRDLLLPAQGLTCLGSTDGTG